MNAIALIAMLLAGSPAVESRPVEVNAECEAGGDELDSAFCRLARFAIGLLSPGNMVDQLKREKLRRELQVLHSAVVQIRQDKSLLIDGLERNTLRDSSVHRVAREIAGQVQDVRSSLRGVEALLEQSGRAEASALAKLMGDATTTRKGWLDELQQRGDSARRADLTRSGKVALVALDSASRSLGRVINALR
jgi:hypothetical protein